MRRTGESNRGSDRSSLPFPALAKKSPCCQKILSRKRPDKRPDKTGDVASSSGKNAGKQPRFEIVEVVQAARPLELGDFVSYRFLRTQTALLASLVFHLGLLLVLSLLLIQVGMGRAAIVLQALIPHQPDELLELSFAPDDDENLEHVLQDDNSNPLLAASNVVFHELSQQLATEIQPRSGDRSGDQAAGNAAEFFGTRVSGHSFVYVLDRSQSMGKDPRSNRSASDTMFTRFDAASEELLRSVGQLTKDQEFYVLLFSTQTTRMFDDQSARPTPLKATDENKRKLADWLRSTRVGGGTDPGDSLQLALKIKPDAIFMLSDGEFGGHVPGSTDAAMEVVTNQTDRNVAIHTVALEDEASKRNMREIASLTGGEFRFVKLTESLDSILRGSDVQSRTRAYNRLTSFTAIEWHDRLKIAKQAIADLANEDAKLQKAAEDSLHYLSFDIFKPTPNPLDQTAAAPPWTIPSIVTNPELTQQICQAWESNWQKGRLLQQELSDPTQDDRVVITQSPVETRLLVAYGDFSNLRSLKTATTLSKQKLPPNQQTIFAQSMVKFQDHFDSADLFVNLTSPDAKKQGLALQSLIGKTDVRLSWNDRHHIATAFAIPLLRCGDPESQAAAESALNYLSFGLFSDRIAVQTDQYDSDYLASQQHEPQDIIQLWETLWQASNQLKKNPQLPISPDAEDAEEQLLAYLGAFDQNQNISALKEFSKPDVSIDIQISLAQALVNVQQQFGITQDTRDLLKTLCNNIYPERRNTRKYWDSRVTSEAWRLRLKNAIRQRQSAARRLFHAWKRFDDNDLRKASYAKKLIERYPESEYATTVRRADVP